MSGANPSDQIAKAAPKNSPPVFGDGEEDKAALSSTSGGVSRRKERIGRGGGVENKRVPAKPAQVQDMMRERAEKLVTLRRGRFDEFTWAALGGLAAATPAFAHSASEVTWDSKFSLSVSQAVDFGVFLVFLVLMVASFFREGNYGPNAMEYLIHHFGKDPDGFVREPVILRCRRWFVRRWTELTGPL